MDMEMQAKAARMMQAMTVKAAQESWEGLAKVIWDGLRGKDDGWLELEGPVWDDGKLASFGVGSENRTRMVRNVGRAMSAVGVWPGSVLAKDDSTWFAVYGAFKMVHEAMEKINGGQLTGMVRLLGRSVCVNLWEEEEAEATLV